MTLQISHNSNSVLNVYDNLVSVHLQNSYVYCSCQLSFVVHFDPDNEVTRDLGYY